MPRSPEDRVIRDSRAELWSAVRDGIVWSTDLTPDGKLRPSLAPTPENSQAWAAQVQASTPFGRQESWRQTLSIVPPSPTEPPVRTPLGEVHVNILRSELGADDRKRAAVDAALHKIKAGMRELELAQQM